MLYVLNESTDKATLLYTESVSHKFSWILFIIWCINKMHITNGRYLNDLHFYTKLILYRYTLYKQNIRYHLPIKINVKLINWYFASICKHELWHFRIFAKKINNSSFLRYTIYLELQSTVSFLWKNIGHELLLCINIFYVKIDNIVPTKYHRNWKCNETICI